MTSVDEQKRRGYGGREGTHESVDFRVLLEREVERERGEEDDRLHVVKVRYPVLALLTRNPQAAVEACEKAQRGMASSSRIGITAHSTRITMIIGS